MSISSGLSGLRTIKEQPSVWCLLKGRKKKKLQYVFSTKESAYKALASYKGKKYFVQQYLLYDLYKSDLVLDAGVAYTNANMTELQDNALDYIKADNTWLDVEGNPVEPKLLGS